MNPEAIPTDPDAPPSSRSDPRPGAGRLAFAALAPERAALDPRRVRHPHVDVLAAAATVLGALEGLNAMRGELARMLPGFPIEHLDRLEVRAHAAAHAQLECIAPETDRPALRAKLREALDLRRTLLVAARALAQRGLLDAENVEATWTGRGHLHLVVQLIALARLLVESWPRVARRTAVTREEIDRAEALAMELAALLGARHPVGGHRPRGRSLAAHAVERDRAFSLLHEDYAAVRRAIAFVRHAEGDADWIAPPMAWERDRRRRTSRAGARSSAAHHGWPITGPRVDGVAEERVVDDAVERHLAVDAHDPPMTRG